MNKRDVGVQFRFRRNDRIGAPEAEGDDLFLFECFVDTGDIDVLKDASRPERIIVGRTGSGKSALLRKLENDAENTIRIPPENLALNYLSNSEVIRFYEEAGTNLDLFYQLLWRHVLVVELIKFKYKIQNEQSQKSFLSSLTQIFHRDKAKEKAVDYLRLWGESFWNETHTRIKEMTTRIEDELKSGLGSSSLIAKISVNGASKLTAEEKKEVVTHGSRVVAKIQIKELAEVIKLLAEEIFNDPQEIHYIVIDDLDTQWAGDPLKNRLIRALIETVKTFRQIPNVKVVVALRQDLLERVIATTRDSGFQSEKYESLYLKIKWSERQIEDILNRRIGHLVRQRYTSRTISMTELFPPRIQKSSFSEFLIGRTFLRPRDAIIFINSCLDLADGRGQIDSRLVLEAEGSYSEKRIESLQDEWSATFPKVASYLKIFARGPTKLLVSDLSEEKIKHWAFEYLLNDADLLDPITRLAQQTFLEEKLSFFKFKLELLQALYSVGAIGIKPEPTTKMLWSYCTDYQPSDGSIRPTSVLELHPVFWRAVGARPTT